MNTPSSFQQKFSYQPLDLRVLRGVRVWSWTPFEGIRGLRGRPWVSGENTAVCLARPWITRDAEGNYSFERAPKHSVADPSCTCGYYAYFDTDVFGYDARCTAFGAIGVIEGYGDTTAGPLGFRSQKAKILSLWGFVSEGLHRSHCQVSHRTQIAQLNPRYSPSLSELLGVRFPEVALFSDFKMMLEEFPTSSIEELAG